MIVLYMLDAEGNVQVAPDPCTLATWMNDPSHIQIAVERRRGVRVSTVFLGYNYNFHAGPPIVFETMVFGGPGHIRCWQERLSYPPKPCKATRGSWPKFLGRTTEEMKMENSDLLCAACGLPLTPENAKRHPEYFMHDHCLSPDFRPAEKPQGLEELIAAAAKGCVLVKLNRGECKSATVEVHNGEIYRVIVGRDR